MYLMPFLLGEVVSVDPAGVGLGSRGLQVQTILVFVLLDLLTERQHSTKVIKEKAANFSDSTLQFLTRMVHCLLLVGQI